MKGSAKSETLSMSLTIPWDGVHGAMEDAAVDQDNALAPDFSPPFLMCTQIKYLLTEHLEE